MQHQRGGLPSWRQGDDGQPSQNLEIPSLPPLPPWSTVPAKRAMDDNEEEQYDSQRKRLRESLLSVDDISRADRPSAHPTKSHMVSSSPESTNTSQAIHKDADPGSSSPPANISIKPTSPYTAIKQIIKHMQSTSMSQSQKKTGMSSNGGCSSPVEVAHKPAMPSTPARSSIKSEPNMNPSDDGRGHSMLEIEPGEIVPDNPPSSAQPSGTSPKVQGELALAQAFQRGGCQHYPQHDISDQQATIRCLRAELWKMTKERDKLRAEADKQTSKATMLNEEDGRLRKRNGNQKVAVRNLELKVDQLKDKAANKEREWQKEKERQAAKTDKRLLEENAKLHLKLQDQRATTAFLSSRLKTQTAPVPLAASQSTPHTSEVWQEVNDGTVLDQLATLKAKEEWWGSEKQLLLARVKDADTWREEKEAEWVSAHTAWERERVGYERRIRALGGRSDRSSSRSHP